MSEIFTLKGFEDSRIKGLFSLDSLNPRSLEPFIQILENQFCFGIPNVEQEPIEIDAPLITSSILFQSYPNPVNNSAWIPFKVSFDANVSLEIYNILGQKVRTIDIGQKTKGSYTQKERAIFWDLRNDNGQNISSRLYFIR